MITYVVATFIPDIIDGNENGNPFSPVSVIKGSLDIGEIVLI